MNPTIRTVIIAALALAASGSALAQVKPPRDLTGNYLGRWNDKAERGPGGRGVTGLTFSQAGAEGTFTGLATPRDASEKLELEGTYEVAGRRITGEVQIRVQGSADSETATVVGRCSRSVKRIRLKLVSTAGYRIKLKVQEFF